MEEKKKYEKPEIKKVSLVSDEAVLTGCKIFEEAGAGSDFPCNVGYCKLTALS